jgi:hypothetical protein
MNKYWAMYDLQNRVRDLPLKSGNQMNILSYLALCSNPDGGNCFPSVGMIAKKTKLGESTVHTEMRRLRIAGWITCIDNHNGGKGKPRVYQLNIPAGKGQQMKLGIDPRKGAASNTLSRQTKGAESDGQRVQTKAPKGAKSCSPIRNTLIYPIGPLPGEPKPAGNPPNICSEISPEDLPSISFDQHVVTELCLQHENGMVLAVAGAIDFCVKFESKTKSSATEYLIALARDEITHGGSPTRFWFTDRKWRKANGNGSHKTAAGSRAARNVEAIVLSRMGRGV